MPFSGLSSLVKSVGASPWAISALGIGGGLAGAALFATQRTPEWEFSTSTALISGGSTGIGLEVAKLLVIRNAKHVVIAARREEVLKNAVEALKGVKKQCNSTSEVHYVVMDVCSEASVNAAVVEAQRLCSGAAVSLLVCSAGFAKPRRFLESSISDAEEMMQTNYFGCLRLMWVVMPSMIAQGRGRIVLTSSLAALAPIAGYTLYAGTKAGLRALAHSVDMENSCLGVRVQVVSPPDVETPGFEKENEVKSPECRAISSYGGAKPFSAEAMARKVVEGIRYYRFDITLGLDGTVLQQASAGMEPATSAIGLLREILFSGVSRLILALYSKIHYGIVREVRLGRPSSRKGDTKKTG